MINNKDSYYNDNTNTNIVLRFAVTRMVITEALWGQAPATLPVDSSQPPCMVDFTVPVLRGRGGI